VNMQIIVTVTPIRMPPNKPDSNIAGRNIIGPNPSANPPRDHRRNAAKEKNIAPIAIPSQGRSRRRSRKICATPSRKVDLSSQRISPHFQRPHCRVVRVPVQAVAVGVSRSRVISAKVCAMAASRVISPKDRLSRICQFGASVTLPGILTCRSSFVRSSSCAMKSTERERARWA